MKKKKLFTLYFHSGAFRAKCARDWTVDINLSISYVECFCITSVQYKDNNDLTSSGLSSNSGSLVMTTANNRPDAAISDGLICAKL